MHLRGQIHIEGHCARVPVVIPPSEAYVDDHGRDFFQRVVVSLHLSLLSFRSFLSSAQSVQLRPRRSQSRCPPPYRARHLQGVAIPCLPFSQPVG